MASAIDCTGGETEHYVSLAVSKDSDDEDAVTTFMTASKSVRTKPKRCWEYKHAFTILNIVCLSYYSFFKIPNP